MAGLKHAISRDWYRNRAWLWLLSPLSALFFLISVGRRQAFKYGLLKSFKLSAPVIVVGNISVGGTGKTPLVAALVEHLQSAGYRPGIVSRGYGGQPPHRPFSVVDNTPPLLSGDEPLLLRRRTGAPVMIDADRVAACRALIQEAGCDVIVADDGLQHYRMQRDIEIAVIDAERGLGNRKLLPMGPLRETPARLRTVDYIVVNGGGPAPADLADSVPMTLQPGKLVNLSSGETLRIDQWVGSTRVHALAGIGYPQRFFSSLRSLGFDVIEHPFADHHHYCDDDIQFNDELPVLMTEKDAVKCAPLPVGDHYWYLVVDAILPAEFFTALSGQLRRQGHGAKQETV